MEWLFGWRKNLGSITLPEGLTSIGSWAFSGCKSITTITLPKELTSIGGNAFYLCESLSPEQVEQLRHRFGDSVL